jgi:hypothetical protein
MRQVLHFQLGDGVRWEDLNAYLGIKLLRSC